MTRWILLLALGVTPALAGLGMVDEPEPPEPEPLEDTVTEELIDVDDSEYHETTGTDSLSDEPFEGPRPGAAIGLGGRGGAGNLRVSTEDTVELGLQWLASQQDPETGAIGDVEETALAVLAMLGAGYTDRGSMRENRYAKCVRGALRFLLKSQDDEGSFCGRAEPARLRVHAIATLALAEAFWMTRNPRYAAPTKYALDLLLRQRLRSGGWREGMAVGDDTLTTTWAVAALTSCQGAGLDVDPDAFEGARRMLEARRCSLEPTGQAAALWARIAMGENPVTSEALQPLAEAVLARKPVCEDELPSLDLLCFGTRAMFQCGGPRWHGWNDALRDAVQWRTRPGELKIGDQAKLALCLEVYYRYDRVFGVK